jgi:hypothetical protein
VNNNHIETASQEILHNGNVATNALPKLTSAGTAGQVLSSNGDGTLTWITAPTSSSDITPLTYN